MNRIFYKLAYIRQLICYVQKSFSIKIFDYLIFLLTFYLQAPTDSNLAASSSIELTSNASGEVLIFQVTSKPSKQSTIGDK